MSDGCNADFRSNTLRFISDNFMTAVGISGVNEGSCPFNLNKHTVEGNTVIRLSAWAATAGENPLLGYWVPQGGSCVVPAEPGARQFVFTPDFSGCYIRVDQVDGANYRVYHVQGGGNYMQTEYSSKDHGRGLAGSLDFSDYGDDDKPRAFAFLKFEGGAWQIYFQKQNGVGLSFNNNVFTAMGPQTVRGGGIKEVAKL